MTHRRRAGRVLGWVCDGNIGQWWTVRGHNRAGPNGGGGTFVTGGYTGEINGVAMNPLAGRQAWCGENTGYIDTEINLGSHLNGQTVKLRFRMGTDLFQPGDGVHVDGLTINGGSCPP